MDNYNTLKKNSNTTVTIESLIENNYIKVILVIMNKNGKGASGLVAIINHVNDMEKFIKMSEN